MMTLSESLGQKCHPVSHAAPLKRNTPTPGELVPCHTKSSLGGLGDGGDRQSRFRVDRWWRKR